MIDTVISGGQTGADQAGLRAAKALGIKTGGWACHGFRTEAGQALWLATEYGLLEHPEYGYTPRTRDNVRDADATWIFGRPSSGSNLTQRFCGEQFYSKTWAWIHWPRPEPDAPVIAHLRTWIRQHPAVHVLNIAGNREETNPGIGAWTEGILRVVLRG